MPKAVDQKAMIIPKCIVKENRLVLFLRQFSGGNGAFWFVNASIL
jgi:hypothetical protein